MRIQRLIPNFLQSMAVIFQQVTIAAVPKLNSVFGFVCGLAVLCAVLFSCTEVEKNNDTGGGNTGGNAGGNTGGNNTDGKDNPWTLLPNPPDAEGSTDGGLLVADEETGTVYELHTFIYDPDTAVVNQTEYTLTFPAGFAGVSANVIVVAGGGGGGAANGADGGGGGGGGGVIFDTAYSIPAGPGSISVKVGGGGPGGPTKIWTAGSGADSVFGTLTAKGGGGGAGSDQGNMQGISGGSSGGGGAANNWHCGSSPAPFDGGSQGNIGGAGSGAYSLRDCGGGGGGAGGPGTDGQEGIPGAGGDARTISDIPYYTEMDFSPGGMGSDILTRALTIDDAAVISPEYGSGGDAGISTNDNASWSSTPDDILAGAAGKAGVVIVWWEYAGAL